MSLAGGRTNAQCLREGAIGDIIGKNEARRKGFFRQEYRLLKALSVGSDS